MWRIQSFRLSFLTRVILAILVLSCAVVNSTSVRAQTGVGAGSYTTTLPAGATPPQATIYKTANVTGKMATNDWWSSLAWHVYPNGSENLYPHPLMVRAVGKGLNIGYPNALSITPDGRKYEYTWAGPSGSNEAMIIGTAGLNAAHTDIRVDGFSDWTVTADWMNGNLKTTIGHGMPFVYATKGTTADALITFISAPTIVSNSGGAVHATLNGKAFGIYGPAGSTWTLSGVELRSSLAGKNYFSVAALPDTSATTFNDFKTHAMVFVTGSSVSWSYNPSTANVASTYTVSTSVKEGTETRVLQALYRHQWMNSTAVNTSYTYVSPRGEMRVLRGNSFVTNMKFTGVLPWLPDLGTYNRTQLYNYVNDVYNEPDAQRLGGGQDGDTYWVGKGLGRLAMLVPIAEQMGHTAAKDRFLNDMKGVLQNWYTASAGETNKVFYYDNNWGTLIGYPASYGSNTELNDHHFHYGYYVMAAAIVSMYDQNWASQANWGAMTELLVKDAANWSSTETRFPRLRNFDPYAGHAWASGSQPFAAGNNQESSSESTNFSIALILWGASTGNTAVRDLGIYLYTTEAAAIEQYWFDIDNVVLPNTNYNHNYVAMVWSDGGSYSTWWTANAEEIHGINILPLTAGHLYLGKRPTYVNSFYNEMVASNGGQETEWVDIHWMYQAFANPSAAITKFGSGGYTAEAGESKAHTYHWLHNFNALGNFEPSVTGNIPTSASFLKGTTRTYVAYNPSSTAVTVTFSNGATLNVPARSLATSAGGGTLPTNTPSGPTATRTNTPSVPTNTPVGPTATRTNTPVQPTSTPGSNILYVIDGASTTINGALSTSAGTSALTDTIPTAGGGNWDGTPHSQITYVISGLSGTYDSTKTTQFKLYLDAYTGVGSGTQARISYDFTGDGTYDRVETYNYFATNPVNDFELYDQTRGLKSATGTFANLSNGLVRLEVWNAIGNVNVDVRTSATSAQGNQSTVTIPFNGGTAPTATRTNTSVPPTATRTNTPVGPTATRTNTPVPPTATRTNTSIPSSGNILYVIDGTTLSFTAGTGALTDTISSAGGGNWDGNVHLPLTYTITGVTRTYNAAAVSQFNMFIDAGTSVGNATQVRISYDFTGDGTYDRLETYNYFATDPVVGWENYTQANNIKSASGTFANLSNGRIRIEIWSAIGMGTTNLRTSATSANGSQSRIVIPYN